MKKLLILIFPLFIGFSNAQIGNQKDWTIIAAIIATRLELTVMDDKSFMSFGPKIPINDKHYVSLRGHFNWWDTPDRKLVVIPELDYLYKVASFEKNKAIITNLYTAAGVSPNAISPKVGINFCHFLSAEAGYNFEYNAPKHFSTEGFRFSLGFNVIF